jgi:hypothetical protein
MFGDSAINNGNEVQITTSSTYLVSSGDVMAAIVSELAGIWTLSLADTTKSWTYQTAINFPTAPQSSAEWIVERPSVCSPSCTPLTLANFGAVTFTGSNAVSTGASQPASRFRAFGVEMTSSSGSTVLDNIGPLDVSGQSFTATYLSS